jgi:hypothetical protein
MPNYEYASRDGRVTMDVIRPINDRDLPVYLGAVRLFRVTVPRKLNVIGIASDPTDGRDNVFKSYHRLECEQGNNFDKVSEFSKSEIKKIWNEPLDD